MLVMRAAEVSSAAWRFGGGASTTPGVRPSGWPGPDVRQYRERVPTTRENLRLRWGLAGWEALFLATGLPLWAVLVSVVGAITLAVATTLITLALQPGKWCKTPPAARTRRQLPTSPQHHRRPS